jgi:hypothetical protein
MRGLWVIAALARPLRFSFAVIVYLLDAPATEAQIEGLRSQASSEVRLAVDVELALVAAGGEYHQDCEDVLLTAGSNQDDIWGATWIRATKAVEFVSVINIRPRYAAWTMELRDEVLRARTERVVRAYLEAV